MEQTFLKGLRLKIQVEFTWDKLTGLHEIMDVAIQTEKRLNGCGRHGSPPFQKMGDLLSFPIVSVHTPVKVLHRLQFQHPSIPKIGRCRLTKAIHG